MMSLVIRMVLFPFSSGLLKPAFWCLNVCFSEWAKIILCAEHRLTQGQQDRDTADLSMPAPCQLQCHLQGVRAPHLQSSPEGPAVPLGAGWLVLCSGVSAGGQGKWEHRVLGSFMLGGISKIAYSNPFQHFPLQQDAPLYKILQL